MTGVSSPYSANSYSGPMRRTGVSMADRVEPLEAFGIPRGPAGRCGACEGLIRTDRTLNVDACWNCGRVAL